MGNTHQNCTCKPPKITSLKVRAYTSTFANLDLDVYEKKDRDSNLHLLVKRYRDGTMTPRLHNLNIGQLKILFETFGNLRPLIIYFRLKQFTVNAYSINFAHYWIPNMGPQVSKVTALCPNHWTYLPFVVAGFYYQVKHATATQVKK